MRKIYIFIFWVLCEFAPNHLLGQTKTDSTSGSTKAFSSKWKIYGLPIIYYTPETRLVFGASIASTFRSQPDSIQRFPSFLQLAAAFTQNKQSLYYIPYRIFFRKANYEANGDFGYYLYSYYFYGIGNNEPQSNQELYSATFPEIKFHLLKSVSKNLRVGIKYWFDHYQITKKQPGKQLATNPGIPGSNGGSISGIGPALNFDSRDNFYFPTKGIYLKASALWYNQRLGSNFNYTRVTINFSKYLLDKWHNVVAMNLFGDFISGNPPFMQMALIGGDRIMRGYYLGRYRDKNLLALAGEYRLKIYGRLGGDLFVNYGSVANSLSQFSLSEFKYTWGGGLRFRINRKEKINFRLDVGFGKNTSGVYGTIGEAF
ncbi:MAG: BamA/TamA family outer membrane protein [Chitinophagaceae bacterium]